MSGPPPPNVPPPDWDGIARYLQGLYQACQNGSTAAGQQNAQALQQTLRTQGPGLADTLRQMLSSLQHLIRPAMLAAGAAWASTTVVVGQVAAFVGQVTAGVVGAILSAEFLIIMFVVLVLVLLYWWSWHRQKEEWRRAGYNVAMHSPQDGFPVRAPAAAEFRSVARTPVIGPIEVLEGRGTWKLG